MPDPLWLLRKYTVAVRECFLFLYYFQDNIVTLYWLLFDNFQHFVVNIIAFLFPAQQRYSCDCSCLGMDNLI